MNVILVNVIIYLVPKMYHTKHFWIYGIQYGNGIVTNALYLSLRVLTVKTNRDRGQDFLICGDLWRSVEICGDLWRSVEICGDLWKLFF
jgi:hypothetical protein